MNLRYTPIGDGPSDACLRPIIDWVLDEIEEPVIDTLESNFADFRMLPRPPRTLAEKVARAQALFPCELLFVHRDAESDTIQAREAEIENATTTAQRSAFVPIVPVKMTEAWLLFDPAALRRAAENPNGRQPITLPRLARIESLPDPKAVVHDLLLEASELRGRRRDQFKKKIHRNKTRIASLIQDFSPLRTLPAFQRFERRTQQAIRALAEGSHG